VGVHPRCFGERISSDFTKKFRCNTCLFESQAKSDEKKCMICRRNDGFMKCDLTVLNGKRVHRWWHPFCVFTNKFCYIQNLYQMRQAEFVYVNALKTNRRGFEVCVYCNEEEDISETRLERCYKCSHLCLDEPRKFHSMCAWLHGCHFA